MKRLIIIFALFAFNLNLSVYAQSVKTAGINIDSRTRYQHVAGFGGFTPSPTWQYWLNNSQIDMLFGKGENQLGLNIARLYIANNRNYWNGGVSNAKQLKKHGVFIFASPWSPPAAWKSNNNDSNGGSLLASHYADWANFLNDYQKYMRQQGAPIDAVSIQNEADYKASYQSCVWTEYLINERQEKEKKNIDWQTDGFLFARSVNDAMLANMSAWVHILQRTAGASGCFGHQRCHHRLKF